MLPRFADIFQQGNRWLNWLEKESMKKPGAVTEWREQQR